VNAEQVKPSKDMLPNKSLCNLGKSGLSRRVMNFRKTQRKVAQSSLFHWVWFWQTFGQQRKAEQLANALY
jgi:hypothetical protein